MIPLLFAMVDMALEAKRVEARFYANSAPAHQWWIEEETKRMNRLGWWRSTWVGNA